MRILFLVIFLIGGIQIGFSQNTTFVITRESPAVITPAFFNQTPIGGDTIFISEDRVQSLIFEDFIGNDHQPLVFINQGGQVNINSPESWSALEFKNCRYIKVSGNGSVNHKYGFNLKAQSGGVGITGLSTNCELEYIHIDHDGFFGIQAKKDFYGFPPNPIPVFEKLVIHDCFIENVSEGMYLGETITPGMEFRHIRIFNNILFNTKREGIQIANMTEDVEIYNNLLLKSGIEQLFSHGNNLQIGDNSVANIYNNILMDAPENGVIVLGAGDISIRNNYIENNRGIFIDNRSVTIEDGEIVINENYFYESSIDVNITNLNELNPIHIYDNLWYGNPAFIKDNSGNKDNLTEWNNIQQSFIPLSLENPETGNFNLSPDNSERFFQMGLQDEMSYVFNYRPLLDSIGDIYIDWNNDTSIIINASTPDNDVLEFTIENFPNFVTSEDISNGKMRLIINPRELDFGKYPIKVSVSDQSHQAKSREKINIIVRNPQNTAPILKIENELFFEILSFYEFKINYSDAEGDEVTITAENLPEFAKIINSDGLYFLQFSTRYIDAGIYNNLKIIADDGFGLTDTTIISINVQPKKLEPGMPVFRVNCGGPEIKDSILNWEGAYNQRLLYETTNNHHTGSFTWQGLNTTGAPDNLFGPWSFDYEGGEEMKWIFPCENGTYIVNLFFAENENDINTVGAAICNINIQGENVVEGFNIFDEVGYAALKKSFKTEVINNEISLEFIHVKNNPKLNGIEIIYNSAEDSTSVNNKTERLKNESSDKKLSLFPVPADNYLYLILPAIPAQTLVNIDLLTIQGKVVSSLSRINYWENPVKILLDRSQIPPGIYVARVNYTSGFSAQKTFIIK